MEIYFYLGVLQIEEEISLWLGLWLLGRLGACMQERREMREATEEKKKHMDSQLVWVNEKSKSLLLH